MALCLTQRAPSLLGGVTPTASRDAVARSPSIWAIVAVFLLALPRSVVAVESGASPAAEQLRPTTESYEALLERVRSAPLLELSDPMFPVLLISGERHGGLLMFATSLHDPMNPSTLERNFDDWNLSARASLLLSYARLVNGRGQPRPYVGLPEDMRRAFDAFDTADRARIRQVVKSGGYMESWRPFAIAFNKFSDSADQVVPPTDTEYSDTQTADTVAHLARDQGLFRLVRELPIDPTDVTNEMLRLVYATRALMGAPDVVTDSGPNLFYACGWDPVTVHVHSWHRLASVFFQAAAAVEGRNGDVHALVIMTAFDGISRDIKVWAAKHPDASTVARDKELNDMARARGLFTLLAN
jgi:hypothetical protein